MPPETSNIPKPIAVALGASPVIVPDTMIPTTPSMSILSVFSQIIPNIPPQSITNANPGCTLSIGWFAERNTLVILPEARPHRSFVPFMSGRVSQHAACALCRFIIGITSKPNRTSQVRTIWIDCID